jgi:hypothetical protein
VTCGLAGARVFAEECIGSSTMNFSSGPARIGHAKALAERARTGGKVDWIGLVEELSTLVLRSFRAGFVFVSRPYRLALCRERRWDVGTPRI